MSRLQFAAAIICATMVSSLASLDAQDMICTGSTDLPAPGGSGPVCSNGKMIIAATGSAPIMETANIPYQFAVKMARKAADLNARETLAKFLNTNNVSSDDDYSDSASIANQESDLEVSSSSDYAGNVSASLPPGVAVIANNTHDGTVYVTVAISPELQELAKRINNQR